MIYSLDLAKRDLNDLAEMKKLRDAVGRIGFPTASNTES